MATDTTNVQATRATPIIDASPAAAPKGKGKGKPGTTGGAALLTALGIARRDAQRTFTGGAQVDAACAAFLAHAADEREQVRIRVPASKTEPAHTVTMPVRQVQAMIRAKQDGKAPLSLTRILSAAANARVS